MTIALLAFTSIPFKDISRCPCSQQPQPRNTWWLSPGWPGLHSLQRHQSLSFFSTAPTPEPPITIIRLAWPLFLESVSHPVGLASIPWKRQVIRLAWPLFLESVSHPVGLASIPWKRQVIRLAWPLFLESVRSSGWPGLYSLKASGHPVGLASIPWKRQDRVALRRLLDVTRPLSDALRHACSPNRSTEGSVTTTDTPSSPKASGKTKVVREDVTHWLLECLRHDPAPPDDAEADENVPVS